MKHFAFITVVALALTACGGDPTSAPAMEPTTEAPAAPAIVEPTTLAVEPTEPGLVTREELGDKWPFTVDSGVIACDGDAVTFTAEGVTYAVNGTATAREMGIDINAIWAENPGMPGTGLKIDISPIINRGLEMCR
jgi:hypothetical protein